MQKYCLHACKHHILCRLYKVKSRNQCSNCWMIISKLAPFQWKNKVSWNAMLQLKGPENEINVGIMQATLFLLERALCHLLSAKAGRYLDLSHVVCQNASWCFCVKVLQYAFFANINEKHWTTGNDFTAIQKRDVSKTNIKGLFVDIPYYNSIQIVSNPVQNICKSITLKFQRNLLTKNCNAIAKSAAFYSDMISVSILALTVKL